jgi:hypothetical protein
LLELGVEGERPATLTASVDPRGLGTGMAGLRMPPTRFSMEELGGIAVDSRSKSFGCGERAKGSD